MYEVKYLNKILPEIKKFLFSRGSTPELPLKLMPLFSDFVWGIQRKCLTIIGARTSEGKSALAMQIAYDLAIQGKTVLFLSLETTVEKMGARLFCLHNKYNNTKAFRGGLNIEPYQWDKFESEISEIPLIINDMLGKSWDDIDRVVRDSNIKPDMVIIDYIQTIAKKDGMNKKDTIDEYIRRFREMSIRHNFAAIICSQINRTSVEDSKNGPQLHHFKESGFIEEHADVAFLLSWPYKNLIPSEIKLPTYEQIHKFIIYVAKNKDGQTGYKKLKFTPEYYFFEDWIDVPKEMKRPDEHWRE